MRRLASRLVAVLALCCALSGVGMAQQVEVVTTCSLQTLPVNSSTASWHLYLDATGNLCVTGGGGGGGGGAVTNAGTFAVQNTAAIPAGTNAIGSVIQGGRTPVAGAQYGLAVASSTALTVPATATVAVVTIEGAAVRYTSDGATTPTASVGMGPFPIGTTLTFNLVSLAGVRIIQTNSAATIDVEYFK